MRSAQLELQLPWEAAMAENSVATSVDLVVSDWALDGAMSGHPLPTAQSHLPHRTDWAAWAPPAPPPNSPPTDVRSTPADPLEF